jgi:hypothetical protein
MMGDGLDREDHMLSNDVAKKNEYVIKGRLNNDPF